MVIVVVASGLVEGWKLVLVNVNVRVDVRVLIAPWVVVYGFLV